MKAINNPREIDVLQFNEYPCEFIIKDDSKKYYVWNELHKSKIYLEPGDFVNITDSNDIYPIKKEVFEKTYKRCEY